MRCVWTGWDGITTGTIGAAQSQWLLGHGGDGRSIAEMPDEVRLMRNECWVGGQNRIPLECDNDPSVNGWPRDNDSVIPDQHPFDIKSRAS
jgi:hypothetical protein